MTESPLQPRVEGLVFPDCPRWHDDRLWFSDTQANRVYALGNDGALDLVATVEGGPGGIGWLPDGRLLVISVEKRQLLRLEDEGLTVVADLGPHVGGNANEMVVDALGRAYVGNFGFDLQGGEDARTTGILMVEPNGTVHTVAEGLSFPNGMAITPDGQGLLVAESFGRRITAFDIEDDGWLSGGRVAADLDPNVPDGICLDSEGGIWVADPVQNQIFRVEDGGAVTYGFQTGERSPYACILGGPGRRLLYVCTAETSDPAEALQRRSGRIEAVSVPFAGAGLP